MSFQAARAHECLISHSIARTDTQGNCCHRQNYRWLRTLCALIIIYLFSPVVDIAQFFLYHLGGVGKWKGAILLFPILVSYNSISHIFLWVLVTVRCVCVSVVLYGWLGWIFLSFKHCALFYFCVSYFFQSLCSILLYYPEFCFHWIMLN